MFSKARINNKISNDSNKEVQMNILKNHIDEYEEIIAEIINDKRNNAIKSLSNNPIYIELLIEELKKLGDCVKIRQDNFDIIIIEGLDQLNSANVVKVVSEEQKIPFYDYDHKVHHIKVDCLIEETDHNGYCSDSECWYDRKIENITVYQNEMKTLLDVYKQNPDIIFSADFKDHSPEPDTSREFKNILLKKLCEINENNKNSDDEYDREKYYKSGYCGVSEEAKKAGLSNHDSRITIRNVEFIGNDNKRICTRFPETELSKFEDSC